MITFAVDLVVEKLAFVVTFVDEFQHAFSCLSAVLVLAFVNFAVKPLLNTETILLIVFPLSDIFGSIFMCVCALATSFVIDPFTFIYIAISMVELSLPIGLVVFPLAFVLRTIGPDLNAETLPSSVHPFAFV
jgi:hypothetical protein